MMSQNEQRTLMKVLVMMGELYGHGVTDGALKLMISDLRDLELNEALDALEVYRKNPVNKRFPFPAQIRAIVKPEVDPETAAKEVAARITGAVVKFGHARAGDAQSYIGDVGWYLVEKFGGWSHICTNLGVTIDITSFTAQVREAAKGAINFSHQDFQRVLAVGERKKGELTAAKDLLALPFGQLNPPKT